MIGCDGDDGAGGEFNFSAGSNNCSFGDGGGDGGECRISGGGVSLRGGQGEGGVVDRRRGGGGGEEVACSRSRDGRCGV